MPEGIITVAYLAASILFILSLGRLSKQETAQRGNLYGVVGMVIAILATLSLIQDATGFFWLLPVVGIGGITLERAPAVIRAGASAVAVISDLLAGDAPVQRVGDYVAVLGAGSK